MFHGLPRTRETPYSHILLSITKQNSSVTASRASREATHRTIRVKTSQALFAPSKVICGIFSRSDRLFVRASFQLPLATKEFGHHRNISLVAQSPTGNTEVGGGCRLPIGRCGSGYWLRAGRLPLSGSAYIRARRVSTSLIRARSFVESVRGKGALQLREQ